MTVARLRVDMPAREFQSWAAYYAKRAQANELEQLKAKVR